MMSASIRTLRLTKRKVVASSFQLVTLFLVIANLYATDLAKDDIAPTVQLKIRTGAAIEGTVLDYNDHGLVILREKTPYVFGWMEIEAKSACIAHRTAIASSKGGWTKLTAEDHFQLGVFELNQGRRDLAQDSFKEAGKRNATYRDRAREVTRTLVNSREPEESESNTEQPNPVANTPTDSPNAPRPTSPEGSPGSFDLVGQLSEANRAKVLEAYHTFGAKVQEVLGEKMVLIETEHFLIWTDWEEKERSRLERWCEEMYGALSRQLGIARDEPVFLAKCPVFCFRNPAFYLRFAKDFDGEDVRDSIGYTRSIEKNGHVHMALLRRGQKPQDFDRFACTLTHEGTHAFLHRLFSTRLIPHWVNEGYAELVAAEVLGDKCPNAGNAALLARQFAKHNWPITSFLNNVGPIAVHEYSLAHSVVQYMRSLGSDRWSGFIRGLKQGQSIAESLHANYDGMTIDQLESKWRETVSAFPVESTSN